MNVAQNSLSITMIRIAIVNCIHRLRIFTRVAFCYSQLATSTLTIDHWLYIGGCMQLLVNTLLAWGGGNSRNQEFPTLVTGHWLVANINMYRQILRGQTHTHRWLCSFQRPRWLFKRKNAISPIKFRKLFNKTKPRQPFRSPTNESRNSATAIFPISIPRQSLPALIGK